MTSKEVAMRTTLRRAAKALLLLGITFGLLALPAIAMAFPTNPG
jgi:hypothetical protein